MTEIMPKVCKNPFSTLLAHSTVCIIYTCIYMYVRVQYVLTAANLSTANRTIFKAQTANRWEWKIVVTWSFIAKERRQEYWGKKEGKREEREKEREREYHVLQSSLKESAG